MIDENGFRHGVGIIIVNRHGQVFWARRVGQDAWQFPQGGILEGETPEQAMYRELLEEVGLYQEDVKVLACSRRWLHYKLPKPLIRKHTKPVCIGQKQKWFLLEFLGDEAKIDFSTTDSPEFDDWRWVQYWLPLKEVIDFKRRVYRFALREFAGKVNRDVKIKPARKGGFLRQRRRDNRA